MEQISNETNLEFEQIFEFQILKILKRNRNFWNATETKIQLKKAILIKTGKKSKKMKWRLGRE
jgi:hypothetical protein